MLNLSGAPSRIEGQGNAGLPPGKGFARGECGMVKNRGGTESTLKVVLGI